MTTITFDSYKVVNILLEKGFKKEQAEGLLEAVQEADLSEFATKDDLLATKNDLEGAINSLRVEMKDMKAEIFRFIIIVAGVQTGFMTLVIAAFKLF